jgi:hypothetical protein
VGDLLWRYAKAEAATSSRQLAFVADRAMLGFVVFHRNFEHVVASNTHAMDFRRRFFAGLGLGGMREILIILWLAHERILA